MKRVCKDGGETVLMTIVEVVDLARESVEKRKNSPLSERNMDMEAELVETRAVKSTVREQRAGVERRIVTLITQFDGAAAALEKLAGAFSGTDANL